MQGIRQIGAVEQRERFCRLVLLEPLAGFHRLDLGVAIKQDPIHFVEQPLQARAASSRERQQRAGLLAELLQGLGLFFSARAPGEAAAFGLAARR